MNKLIPAFLFVLLGLCALLFYNVSQLQRELDTHSQAITRLDNRLFSVEGQGKGLKSAQGDAFTSQKRFNLSDAPAKFKSRPYCEILEDGLYAVKYGDMETSRYREWQLEAGQKSFSPEEQDPDVEGKFVISGYYIMVDVKTSEGEEIKARFVINDMEDNGDINEYHLESVVNNVENCPDFVNEAFN